MIFFIELSVVFIFFLRVCFLFNGVKIGEYVCFFIENYFMWKGIMVFYKFLGVGIGGDLKEICLMSVGICVWMN